MEKLEEGGRSEKIVVFDTTLRDGEQSPGASMDLAQKLEVARALARLRVDVIEAGFPVISQGDFEAVRAIAREIQGPVICGLARCLPKDIEAVRESLGAAQRRRLHLFMATSAIHRQYKLRLEKAEVVEKAIESVRRAREFFDDIEFSPEDASRTEEDFLVEVVERAIEAGATTVNIPDTVGYAVPAHYAQLIRLLKRQVRGIGRAVISVHCHNDLGLAVANSLAALQAGARQVECTVNGIGERAGNCSLEEIVMALKTRRDYFSLETGIDTRLLCPTSRIVARATGIQVQRNKAIVGQNAFAHEAGIHQHGMLSHRETYEIIRPEDVGYGASQLVLGKHSGRHALQEHARRLGYTLEPAELDHIFVAFKALADKKKEIYEADIQVLIGKGQEEETPVWRIDSLNTSGGGALPTAALCLAHESGRSVQDAACGDGPVDAVFKAIMRATGIQVELRDYQIRSVTLGEDAQGEASVEVVHGERRYRAHAVSTDIIEASAQAFLKAINRVAAVQRNQPVPRMEPAGEARA